MDARTGSWSVMGTYTYPLTDIGANGGIVWVLDFANHSANMWHDGDGTFYEGY